MNKKVISQESTVHGIRYFVDGENALHKFAWYFLFVTVSKVYHHLYLYLYLHFCHFV